MVYQSSTHTIRLRNQWVLMCLECVVQGSSSTGRFFVLRLGNNLSWPLNHDLPWRNHIVRSDRCFWAGRGWNSCWAETPSYRWKTPVRCHCWAGIEKRIWSYNTVKLWWVVLFRRHCSWCAWGSFEKPLKYVSFCGPTLLQVAYHAGIPLLPLFDCVVLRGFLSGCRRDSSTRSSRWRQNKPTQSSSDSRSPRSHWCRRTLQWRHCFHSEFFQRTAAPSGFETVFPHEPPILLPRAASPSDCEASHFAGYLSGSPLTHQFDVPPREIFWSTVPWSLRRAGKRRWWWGGCAAGWGTSLGRGGSQSFRIWVGLGPLVEAGPLWVDPILGFIPFWGHWVSIPFWG